MEHSCSKIILHCTFSRPILVKFHEWIELLHEDVMTRHWFTYTDFVFFQSENHMQHYYGIISHRYSCFKVIICVISTLSVLQDTYPVNEVLYLPRLTLYDFNWRLLFVCFLFVPFTQIIKIPRLMQHSYANITLH